MKKTLTLILAMIMLTLCSCDNTQQTEQSPPASEKAEVVDLDLTTLSSTMVYSEVYNIMSDPASYIGKSIKMTGMYANFTGQDGASYPACIITDATACCQNGIEFDLTEKNYPSEGTQVTVLGVFDSYIDKADGNTYYHLRDAKLI